MSEKKMRLYELKTMICAGCGIELQPQTDPVAGTIDISAPGKSFVLYHPEIETCSHSEEVCVIHMLLDFYDARVIGKMDYSRLPATMKKV